MAPSREIKYTLLNADNANASPHSRTGRMIERVTRPISVILFATIVIAQLLAIYLLHKTLTQDFVPPLRVKSPIPKIPQTIKSFQRESIYFNRSSPETDAAWSALSGPNHGFVHVSDHGLYGLRRGASDGADLLYSISMFHQLHCLSRIRKMMWDLAEKRVDGSELIRLTPNDTSANHEGGPVHGFWEVQHCMDYLRQGIQCAGDVALEWPVQVNGKTLFVGWDTPHECRKAEFISTYVREHS